jgi:hypothetical protein
MIYTLARQQYMYSRGLGAAEQRAEAARLGEAAAALRDLRLSLGHAFRLRHRARPDRKATDAVTAIGSAAPARVLSGAR